jgi:zinc transporter ZupT
MEDPPMNRLLIGILDFLNKLLAIVIIVSSTVSGWYGQFGVYQVTVDDPLHRAIAALVGFAAGIILAAVVSGLLATIINISREMTTIRELLRERPLAMR